MQPAIRQHQRQLEFPRGQTQRQFVLVTKQIQPHQPRIHVEPVDAHRVIVIPERGRFLPIRVMVAPRLARHIPVFGITVILVRHLCTMQMNDGAHLGLVGLRSADGVIHRQEMLRRQAVVPDHIERHARVRFDGGPGEMPAIRPQRRRWQVAMQLLRTVPHANLQYLSLAGAQHGRQRQHIDKRRKLRRIDKAGHMCGIAHRMHAQAVTDLSCRHRLHRLHVMREQPRRDPSRRGRPACRRQETTAINHAHRSRRASAASSDASAAPWIRRGSAYDRTGAAGRNRTCCRGYPPAHLPNRHRYACRPASCLR